MRSITMRNGARYLEFTLSLVNVVYLPVSLLEVFSLRLPIMEQQEPQEKRPCPVKTIGTHNGNFHCDDALACYMLRILPEYKDAK